MMEVIFHSDIEKFYTLGLPFLMQEEGKNNLLIAILNTLRKNVYHYGTTPDLISIHEDKILRYVSIRIPPHNQILAFTEDLSFIIELANNLVLKQAKIPGVLGFKPGAEEFAKIWTQKTNTQYSLEMHERIYELTSVNHATLGTQIVELMKEEDIPLLKSWILNMMKEALHETDESEIALSIQRILDPAVWQNIYVLRMPDGCKSMVRKAGHTPTGRIINLVYTPPEFRNHGYATECVAKISQSCLDEGKQRCLLFTDLSNPTSNSIYQKIGYKPICDIDEYKFHP